MSEMVERVARAICEADGVDPDKEICGMGVQLPIGELAPAWRARLKQARAAIEAMREPTEAMTNQEGLHWGYSCHVCGGLKEGWQAMIDDALKD